MAILMVLNVEETQENELIELMQDIKINKTSEIRLTLFNSAAELTRRIKTIFQIKPNLSNAQYIEKIRVLILHGQSVDDDLKDIETITGYLKNSGNYVPVMCYLLNNIERQVFNSIQRGYYMFIFGTDYEQVKQYMMMESLANILNKE